MEAEQRLTAVLKALRSTARSFPDAALVLNDEGEVMVSNRPARRLLGVRRRLDKGRPARILIDEPEFVRWLKSEGKESVRFKSPVQPDCWLEAQRVPVRREAIPVAGAGCDHRGDGREDPRRFCGQRLTRIADAFDRCYRLPGVHGGG